MKRYVLLLGLILALTACSGPAATDIPTGTDVRLEKRDGVTVEGRLIKVDPQHVVVQAGDGVQTKVPRAQIARLDRSLVRPEAASARASGVPQPASSGPAANETAGTTGAAPAEAAPAYREVTIPAGTVLPVRLATAVGSDTSQVEDPVRGTLRRPVTIEGVTVLPAGSVVTGHVTRAERSARVKGRAQVAFRFTRLDLPGEGDRVQIRTAPVARVAPATKKRDAATIGGGAVGGAIVGGILGGGDGAAKGAAVGGAAGTGAVLATRGREIRLSSGTAVMVRLTAPVTVKVPR